MRNKSLAIIASMLLIVLVCFSSAMATIVDFKELVSTDVKLPYDDTVKIVGKLSDFEIAGQTARIKLVDIMQIRSIAISYVINNQTKVETANIIGDSWSVLISNLPENASVLFSFRLIGSPTNKFAATIFETVVSDTQYDTAISTMFTSAAGKPADEQQVAQKVLMTGLAAMVKKAIADTVPDIVISEKGGKQLEPAIAAYLPSYANLKVNIRDLLKLKVPGMTEKLTPKAAYLALTSPSFKIDSLNLGQKDAVNAFKTNYEKDIASLTTLLDGIQAEFTLASQTGDVLLKLKEFERFFGVDVGAFYAPRLNELRHFFTVNAYYGKVDDNPDAGGTGSGPLNYLQQRLSLTLGVSLGDLSGNSSSDVKDNNAFLYGVGYRLNKYIRITAGGLLYRSVTDKELNNDFCIGASVDLMTLKYIRDVFGKIIP